MKKLKLNNNTFKIILIYIYGFFIFYRPRLLEIFLGINFFYLNYIIILISVLLFGINYIKKLKENNYLIDKNKIFILIIAIFFSSMYIVIRAGISNYPMRFLYNNFIIVQILAILIIIDKLKCFGYNKKDDFIKFILNIGSIQGVICILMFLIPSLKEFANNLYYIDGVSRNEFIISNRIYGLTYDYTVMTPIFHGILANITCIYAVFKGWRYLLYLPFILIVAVLNGRTGLMVFIISTLISYIILLFNAKYLYRTIKYIIYISFMFIVIIILTAMHSQNTYEWITFGFKQVINLLTGKELAGSLDILFNNMLFLPDNAWSILFGEGHRVFNGYNHLELGYVHSDSGYINDIFLGGIVYMLILYGSTIYFLLPIKLKKSISFEDRYLNILVSISLILVLLISNMKGELMKSGSVLLLSIFIKLIITDEKLVDKEEG